ncbi:hypothetical protein PAL_GLEAN10000175 [Pteropus alecto]|uniref:Uncharacterized protein n=1 Tax=Pteropus alecto TaxID=9402 RepID=L5KPJ1_PTEAL|nr:hypothetical protein PAL_GLEAN10000175 [Pteropus alecto]
MNPRVFLTRKTHIVVKHQLDIQWSPRDVMNRSWRSMIIAPTNKLATASTNGSMARCLRKDIIESLENMAAVLVCHSPDEKLEPAPRPCADSSASPSSRSKWGYSCPGPPDMGESRGNVAAGWCPQVHGAPMGGSSRPPQRPVRSLRPEPPARSLRLHPVLPAASADARTLQTAVSPGSSDPTRTQHQCGSGARLTTATTRHGAPPPGPESPPIRQDVEALSHKAPRSQDPLAGLFLCEMQIRLRFHLLSPSQVPVLIV